MTWTSSITSEENNRTNKFWDEPALSAFSDGYVAAFTDNSLTAYTNQNYEAGAWTDNISSEASTRTTTLS